MSKIEESNLYNKEVDFETAYAEALTQKIVFKVPYDVPNLKTSMKLGTIDEAREQFKADAAIVVEEMKHTQTAEMFSSGKITEIVALIAYLNSLGSSRFFFLE